MSLHTNNGSCLGCAKIFNRYPGFYQPLRNWFMEFQRANPEAHICWAGRGEVDQELFFERGSSDAHWGESSHNYNIAIDIFPLINGKANWDPAWYDKKIPPALTPCLEWYGAPDAKFRERPHIQWRGWRALRDAGLIKLVE